MCNVIIEKLKKLKLTQYDVSYEQTQGDGYEGGEPL